MPTDPDQIPLVGLPFAKGFDATYFIRPSEAPAERTARLAREAEESRARLARETTDANHALWRATGTYFASLGLVGIIVALAIWIVVRSDSSPDDKKWATGVLGLAAGAATTFLMGKQPR